MPPYRNAFGVLRLCVKHKCVALSGFHLGVGATHCFMLVSRASRIFLYFRWEEREGEKNTSGHSGQLPLPRRNVIIAAGHAHGMQIKTFIQLCAVL